MHRRMHVACSRTSGSVRGAPSFYIHTIILRMHAKLVSFQPFGECSLLIHSIKMNKVWLCSIKGAMIYLQRGKQPQQNYSNSSRPQGMRPGSLYRQAQHVISLSPSLACMHTRTQRTKEAAMTTSERPGWALLTEPKSIFIKKNGLLGIWRQRAELHTQTSAFEIYTDLTTHENSFSYFCNKRALQPQFTSHTAAFKESLTNEKLLLWCYERRLHIVNLFLSNCSTSVVPPAGVSRLYSYISPKGTRHTRLFSLCTGSWPLRFWQNKHWNFPLFFPSWKTDELIRDFLFWAWLTAQGLDNSWRRTTAVPKANTRGCCFTLQASQV